MSAAMDMFLSASDSLPFPDVLDIDIKSEIDTLVGHNDFSGYSFNNIEPLEFENEIKWFNSNSNHSILDFSGDDGPTMVNPNAVMPVMTIASSNVGRSPSPSVNQSHLTFSPSLIKISSLKTDTSSVKKDLLNRLEGFDTTQKKHTPSPVMPITKVAPILAKPALAKPITLKTTNSNPTILIRNPVKHITTPIITQLGSITTIRALPANALSHAIHRKSVNVTKPVDRTTEDHRAYPKPAYSYSCLIAMALKNSRSGSLPVSEIYNFMCKHFPYFKTAPNGWKNSVRHNLSLSKCFEKIEKPALNGTHRKGCLWAMNPAKISKMDEEVQKWSRKDPSAIRKAMVNPEHLELLERGELKFSCSYDDENDNFGDSCGSAESGEGSDSEEEVVHEEIEEADIDIEGGQFHYIQVGEDEIEEYEEVTEYSQYEDDMEGDKQLLRVEMALAQKELDLEYEKTINNKRRRTYIVQQH
ncbi:uncharacterized protein LOC115874962 [Sitophilus oryzae]|uniref:Uncharacterized protein LOC115874962 n=1 Tax=Sitophilus oryzae TaxID=7048 RepID=A0A6J2X549_SITOR|nr:uncharacterized protein LOC115874962 [Sitophilus oryzae]XP_030746129.1 uncharacterized protein LOC115874962 [Sitophilus oryzae]XP_030746130.1 uncharacterized protein LOC115874962 [Sitophilus oryzae]